MNSPSRFSYRSGYENDETVTLYVGSSAAGLPRTGTVTRSGYSVSLGDEVYYVTSTNKEDIGNLNHVYKSFNPNIEQFGNKPSSLAYYKVSLLEKIQDKVIHPDFSPGWIIP